MAIYLIALMSTLFEWLQEILNQPESDIMGKGDKRTLRGKIFKGSYGKTRPHHPKAKPATKAKPAGKKS